MASAIISVATIINIILGIGREDSRGAAENPASLACSTTGLLSGAATARSMTSLAHV